MSPAELRAEAAWLYELTGCTCAWPIQTEHDLREYANNIEQHCRDELTGAEMGLVWELIERLDPPEEQARKARRAKKYAKYDPNDLEALCSSIDFARSEQRKTFHLKGALARKQEGAKARNEIIRKYNNSTLPKRERAGWIAGALELSPQHVRRVVKAAREQSEPMC